MGVRPMDGEEAETQEIIEGVIHSYLQEKGYDSYVPDTFVAELAARIAAALKGA